MAEIPTNVVTAQDLLEWDEAKKQLALLKNKEMMLRQKIFKAYFPTPKEGTNKAPLANGWELKGGYVLNRAVELGAFTNMRDQFLSAGLRVDDLVKFSPELVKSAYNKLTAEEQNLFDRCLVIKEGSPTLEIVLPAKNRAKEA